MVVKGVSMPPPRMVSKRHKVQKKSTTVTKPHPMYVQMVLVRRTTTEQLEKHIHYLFGCVSWLCSDPNKNWQLAVFCGSLALQGSVSARRLGERLEQHLRARQGFNSS